MDEIYISDPGDEQEGPKQVTAWGGECIVCGQMKAVTAERNFNNLIKPKEDE